MKTVTLATAILIAAIQLTGAEDFKTVDGREYKNATISRVEPDGIVVMTSSGIAKLYFAELPKEVQERFHYDARQATAYSTEQREKEAQYQRQLKEHENQRTAEREKYWRDHPMPVLIPQSATSALHGTALDERPVGPRVVIYGDVIGVSDEGLLVSVHGTNAVGSEVIPDFATVLIIGKFPGFYDEDKVQVIGRVIGPHEYTTVMGSKRTARALADAQVTKFAWFPPNVRQ
jgi:hypothetical protein